MRGDVLKIARLGVLLVAVSSPPASAQAPSEAGNAPRFLETLPTGTLRTAKVIGVPVIGMDHVRVGTIEDVLVDASGRARTVVIGVGGFLGIGEKAVAVPFDQLAWNLEDVSLTEGPAGIAHPGNAPGPQAAARAGPETMPGAQTTNEVLGAVQNRHSGRVTEATGSVEAQRPSASPATILVGDKPWHAEIRLTKAELQAAPAFRFEKSRPERKEPQ